MLSDIKYQIRIFSPPLKDRGREQPTLGQGHKDQGTAAMVNTYQGRGKPLGRAEE